MMSDQTTLEWLSLSPKPHFLFCNKPCPGFRMFSFRQVCICKRGDLLLGILLTEQVDWAGPSGVSVNGAGRLRWPIRGWASKVCVLSMQPLSPCLLRGPKTFCFPPLHGADTKLTLACVWQWEHLGSTLGISRSFCFCCLLTEVFPISPIRFSSPYHQLSQP